MPKSGKKSFDDGEPTETSASGPLSGSVIPAPAPSAAEPASGSAAIAPADLTAGDGDAQLGASPQRSPSAASPAAPRAASARTFEDLFAAIIALDSKFERRMDKLEFESGTKRDGNGAGAANGGDNAAGNDTDDARTSSAPKVAFAADSGDDGSYESSERSDDSPSEVPTTAVFVPIHRNNPHWSAAERRAEASAEPRRFSLYGNKTADALSREREGGGLLGFSLSYLEPISLYMHSIIAYLADIMRSDLDDELHYALTAVFNSARSVYDLANTNRYLIKIKAQAVRPGATDYDKKEAKFLERSLEERDFGTGDVPHAISELRAEFAHAAQKSELSTLSRGAGSGGDPKAYESKSSDGDRKRGSRGGAKTRDGTRRDPSRDDDRRGNGKQRDGGRREGTPRDGESARGGKQRDSSQRGSSGGGTSRDDARRGSRGQREERGEGGGKGAHSDSDADY